jgi:hypothetical protein
MRDRSFRHHQSEPARSRRRLRRPALLLTCAVSSLGLAVAGATAGTTVAAAKGNTGTSGPSAATFAARHYCGSFVSHLARDLGVSEERLQSAVTRAGRETIDDAVASGDLTTKQANALKSYLGGRSICSLGIHGMGKGSGSSATAARPDAIDLPPVGRQA